MNEQIKSNQFSRQKISTIIPFKTVIEIYDDVTSIGTFVFCRTLGGVIRSESFSPGNLIIVLMENVIV